MQISRRDLLRSSAAAGGALVVSSVLGGVVGGLSDEAVAGTVGRTGVPVRAPGTTTRTAVLRKGTAGAGGYRPVEVQGGEASVVRETLGAQAHRGRARRRRALTAFVQVSDVHLVDSESPMRVENGEAFSSSAYRPQEMLTLHVAEAMVQGINAVRTAPVTHLPIAFTLQTGDNADNAQYNEVRWNIDILDGGRVTPGTGDPAVNESVSASTPALYSTMFWHPEGTPTGLATDDYRAKYGFPEVPGLLAKAGAPFDATGLTMPWYAVMGNHDKLVQGNNHPTDSEEQRATGSTKQVGTLVATVTPDAKRRELTTAEIVQEHFTTTGLPVGHGYTQRNVDSGTAYYTFDQGPVRFVVMDTVNANGGAEGSLSRTQLAWLQDVLAASRHRLVVLSSHHPSWSLTNTLTGDVDPGRRVLGGQVVTELLKHPHVVAWVNGHTHSNRIVAHRRRAGGRVVGGFWEINTASHIDWPQQGRIVEIADNRDGTLSIFCTMLDHAAPETWSADQLDDPLHLAALSRELAANDWQERDNHRLGTRRSRNTELLLPAPAFLR